MNLVSGLGASKNNMPKFDNLFQSMSFWVNCSDEKLEEISSSKKGLNAELYLNNHLERSFQREISKSLIKELEKNKQHGKVRNI